MLVKKALTSPILISRSTTNLYEPDISPPRCNPPHTKVGVARVVQEPGRQRHQEVLVPVNLDRVGTGHRRCVVVLVHPVVGILEHRGEEARTRESLGTAG